MWSNRKRFTGTLWLGNVSFTVNLHLSTILLIGKFQITAAAEKNEITTSGIF